MYSDRTLHILIDDAQRANSSELNASGLSKRSF